VTEHEPQYPRYEELYGFGESGLVRRVDIRNFRSIRHAKVELGRFTVLAGANGAGKSNVVDVFRFVSEALSLGLYAALERRAGIQAVRHRNPDESQKASTLSLEFNLWFNNGITADYRFALTSDLRGAFAVSSEEVEMWSASGDLFGSLKFKDGEMTEKPFLLVSDSPWQQENIAEFYLPQSVHVNVESLALPVVASGIGFYEVLSALREMRA